MKNDIILEGTICHIGKVETWMSSGKLGSRKQLGIEIVQGTKANLVVVYTYNTDPLFKEYTLGDVITTQNFVVSNWVETRSMYISNLHVFKSKILISNKK